MRRACLTARLAVLTGVCAVGATVAIATASVSADARASGRTVSTPAYEKVKIRVGGPAAVAATSTAQGFLGIATELDTITRLSGTPSGTDTPFVHLLRNLSPGAPFLLRLGGNSADNSWWPIPGMTERHLGKLTPQWGADVQALLKAVGGTAILGVNLKVSPKVNSRIAAAEVSDFERYVGPSLIDAFELGNEPEFYPLSVVNGGHGHDNFGAYGKKFSKIASALGGAPLAGPSTGSPHWLPYLGTVLRNMHTPLKLVTVHTYPLKDCSPGAHNSASDFFDRKSIQGLADHMHRRVEAAAAHGEPLRVDEINGIPCGGEARISNSFGEALWALNVLPALWQAGVQGVNFQTVDGNLNQMITAKHSGSGWRVFVEPEYYGLLAFADAAPAGSHLLRISGSAPAHVYRFGVRAPDGAERVVLTNVGSRARTIGVTASGAQGTGTVSLLQAKSLRATGGETLSGQRLSPQTGQLAGAPRLTSVSPNTNGEYAVRVPAHAAAILTLAA